MRHGTLTNVRSLGVDAGSVLTSLRILALVRICTVSSRFVQLVAHITQAPEHTECVFAATEHAYFVERAAFVNVSARSGSLHGKALVAFAVVTSGVVDTLAVFAYVNSSFGALVDVRAAEAISPEAVVADAAVRTVSVDTD